MAFKCPSCPYRSDVKHNFQRHVSDHSKALKKCSHCDFTTIYTNSLNRHIKRHVTDKKKYKCRHCSYRSKVEENVHRHTIRIHKKPKLHCPHCNFTTDYRNSLNCHLRQHVLQPVIAEIISEEMKQVNEEERDEFKASELLLALAISECSTVPDFNFSLPPIDPSNTHYYTIPFQNVLYIPFF